MSVSKLRQQWRSFKSAFDQHLGPVLGAKWTKKAFGLGLGPKLDQLMKEYDAMAAAWTHASSFMESADKGSISAMNEVQRKMGSVVKHAATVDRLAESALEKLNGYQNALQQGLNEALHRGSVTPTVQESFRKAFGSLNVMRELVCWVRERARNYYGRNAKHWQETYIQLMRRR
jgi:hypothetical protein